MRLIERGLIAVVRKVEIDKSRGLDHVRFVIYKFRDHDITIVFPLRYKLRQICRYECSLVKNFPTN